MTATSSPTGAKCCRGCSIRLPIRISPTNCRRATTPRIGEKAFNGRVSRLLVSPLLIALKKVVGDRDYIDYPAQLPLPAFGRVRLADGHAARSADPLRLGAGDRRPVGSLAQSRRRNAVCQVEIADAYDHKHQSVSREEAGTGLNRMSTDICKAIFRKLAAEGTVFTGEHLPHAEGHLLPPRAGPAGGLLQRRAS